MVPLCYDAEMWWSAMGLVADFMCVSILCHTALQTLAHASDDMNLLISSQLPCSWMVSESFDRAPIFGMSVIHVYVLYTSMLYCCIYRVEC